MGCTVYNTVLKLQYGSDCFIAANSFSFAKKRGRLYYRSVDTRTRKVK